MTKLYGKGVFMEIQGKINNICRQFNGDKILLTFEVEDSDSLRELYDRYSSRPFLDINVTEHKNDRSRDQNALFWACVHDLAVALDSDNTSVYYHILKRYSKYEYVEILEECLPDLREEWKDIEIVGKATDKEGRSVYQVLCYYGTSKLNMKEFSHLLDGIISEMKDVGIEIPTKIKEG